MKTKLVHEIRQGFLVVRIRRAKTDSVVRHKLSIHRLYKNGDLWHESARLGCDDIPLVRFLLDEAHTWMIEQEGRITSDMEGDE